jgi:uncharacterized membrane protein
MGISNDIKSAGTLGLVGTVLMLVGLIPHAEILSIVGLILVLIALNKLSKAYNNEAIWRNALYGFVMGIVGAVVLTIAVFDYMIPILITLYPYAFPRMVFLLVSMILVP